MVGPPGEVSLKKIVRFYPDTQQTKKKFFQRLYIVIDPFQEYSLTPHRYPRVGKHCARKAQFVGDFIGMIEVGIDVQRMMSFQDSDKVFGNSHRKNGWYSGADANYFNGWDSAQGFENCINFFVLQKEGVASRDQDLPYLWMLSQIVISGVKGRGTDFHPVSADLAFSGTKPAIHGTFIGNKEQYPVRIFMD